MPSLRPQRCQEPGCNSVITSSMYVGSDSTVVCETCYRHSHYGQAGFSKVYKHCALNDAVSAHSYDPHAPHMVGEEGAGSSKNVCELSKLGPVEARAKYEGLKATTGQPTQHKRGLSSTMARLTTGDKKSDKRKPSPTGRRVSSIFGLKGGGRETASQGVFTDPSEDTNVPQFFRKFADKDAYSHVHMALRVGPLVIENGVAK